MKNILTMLIGCALALLLIFLLPAIGLGSGWVLAIVIGAMMLCHLMHFGMHDDAKNRENGHEHRH